jgi:hypothetical protein
MTSLVASAGGIVTQGMGVASNAVARTTLLAGQVVSSALGITGSLIDVAGAGIQAGAQLAQTAIHAGGQIVGAAFSFSINIIEQAGAAIVNIWLAAERIQLMVGQVFCQNLAIAIGEYTIVVFQAITQVFTTLFTSLAAAAGQLFSIPMIMLYGYVAIAATTVQIVPGIISAILSVFTHLFKKITDIFTGDFINKIAEIPLKIGESIITGFEKIVDSLGEDLKKIFIP